MKRKLTIRFQRSVSSPSGRPDRMEVFLQSLNATNNTVADTTFPAVRITRFVELRNDTNDLVFELEPSYTPGFDRPVLYRVAWRKEYMGQIERTDFAMPDADVFFDDLFDLGAIVGPETYLAESDLGVPGRVARLSDTGKVIDSDGNEITGEEAAARVQGLLDQERIERQQVDAANRTYAQQQLNAQVASLTQSTTDRLNAAVAALQSADLTERTERVAAVAALQTTVSNIVAEHHADIAALTSDIATNRSALTTKADLVNGLIPTSQIPSIALGTAVSVADQAAMLALTSAQVQPGDLAIRPDSTWMLISPNPAQLASWKRISVVSTGNVSSVNGQVGAVTLGAADVGARPVGVAVPQADVAGLGTALAAKATVEETNAIRGELTGKASTAALTALESRAVLKDALGLVPTGLLGPDVPLVNDLNQLVKKDGTVLQTGGGSEGAVASVNGKVGSVVLTAADVGARPTGVDIPQAEITGLIAALTGKAAQTDLTALTTRVTQAESDIDALAENQGGTGGGATGNVYWQQSGTGDPADPSTVVLRSPFGRTAEGTIYYNALGAVAAESVWPYVTAHGNLVFRTLDPDAAPDPEYATVDALDALSVVVAEKATLSQLSALETTVTGKADRSEVTALGTRVDGKADQAALDTLTATVATKAAQTDLESVIDSVQDKVDQTVFDARSATVDSALAGKYVKPAAGIPKTDLAGAVQTSLGAADAAKTAVDAASATGAASQLVKADGSGFHTVPTATAAGHPVRKDQFDTALSGKADQTAMTTALAGKADLIGGKLATSQLPALATSETYVVANRAAMLALSTTQVQRGDIAVINDTSSDRGSYILTADDPTVFANWTKLTTAGSAVESVNGYVGVVVLSAADVGARPTGVSIPQSDITGLTTTLSGKADKTYVDEQVATRTTPAQVTTQVTQLGSAKLSAHYAATTPISTLSGQPSIDGTLSAAGQKVLLTAQAASSQNGLWVIQTGAWTRATDAADGATLVPGTVVAVTSGATHADSLWQLGNTAAVTVGTTAQTWAKVLRGGVPKTYTQGDGITIDAQNKIAAKPGPGIIVDTQGIRLDTSAVLRKSAGYVPAGATPATYTHGLGTRDLANVLIYDVATGEIPLAPVTIISENAVSIDFAAAPATNQWRIVVTA